MINTNESALFLFDAEIRKKYPITVGCDEAGRGPLAGPVVAAAVILSGKENLPNLNDSKKIKEDTREKLYEEIYRQAEAVSFFCVSPKEIDEINILNASLFAMYKSVTALKNKFGEAIVANRILIDGNRYIKELDRDLQETVVKGDGKSACIAAASIIAKVTRDRIMCEYAKEYRDFGFEKHKGYPTKAHYEAIERHGVLPIHRMSFLKKTLALPPHRAQPIEKEFRQLSLF